MKKLSRINKLKLTVILKGFFPTMRIIKITLHEVVLRKHFFSIKKIRIPLELLIDEILPKYLMNLELNTDRLKGFIKEYRLLTEDKEKIGFLYSKHVGLSHTINNELTSHILDSFNTKKGFTRIKRYSDQIEETKKKIINLFKKNKSFNNIEKLKELPSTSFTSVQETLLNEKKEFLIKSKYGEVYLSEKYPPIRKKNTIILSSSYEFMETE